MARLILGYALSILTIISFNVDRAQGQTKELTLQDAVLNRFSSFYPERMNQLQWVTGTSTLSFVEELKGVQTLMLRPAASKPKATLSLTTLNEWIGEDASLGSFPRVSWVNASNFQLQHHRNVYSVDLKKKTAKKVFTLPEEAEEIAFNPDRSMCAYVKEHNIYVLTKAGEVRVTDDGAPGLVYGKAVHRNEFGINKGLFWSNDGKKLAFYRMDERMVETYPLVEISTQPATVREIKYPMAGRTSHHVTLGSFDLATKKTVYMNTGTPEDQYLCSVTWSPDASALYIALLNRDQNHLALNRYTAATGAFEKTLLEESDPAYVEPERPLWFMPNDPTKFIWMSERDHYQHMYLYNTDGERQKILSGGLWEVHEILGLDATGKFIYVRGTGEPMITSRNYDDERNALQRYTYAIDLERGSINFIDARKGTHMGSLSDDGKYILEHFTSIDTPWETAIYSAQGNPIETIHEAKDPLEGYALSKPEIGHISGGNAERLYTRLIKPHDFDADKKYPLLIYLYGGPHAQMITDSYLAGAPMWMYWMAEQGYIVATVDNRGSANRGIDFEQATFRNLGKEEMIDQKKFLDYLVTLPYVDASRMAIHGWSFGGFMTINMMLNYPAYFKAGVAGGPVCDWSMYEVMYTERYMDTPEANPEGYAAANLVQHADQLKNDLLVIHGTVDDVVLWQHSQAFVKACVDNEVQLDYFLYPGHPHNVRGKDRYHLMEKVLRYIDERIGDPKPE